MRILYLPAYFYPEKASSYYINENRIEAFVNTGFIIIVHTAIPCRGVSLDVRREYSRKRHLKEEMFGGKLKIHRFYLMKERALPVQRFFRYLVLWFKQLAYSLREKDIDCLFMASTPPTQGLLGAVIKRIKKVPFIYNLQDVFPDSLVGTGMTHKGSLLWRIGRKIENFTYRNADRIIVISEDFKRNIIAKAVPESKIEVIYNWVDADAVCPVNKEDNPLFEEFGLSRGSYTVVYAGNLGNAQNLDIILSAAYMLPQIQFVIFGNGGQEEAIRDRVVADSLCNVHLFPLQPMERVSYVYSLGDACVVSCKAGLGGSAMPSKTWSIMSCGRPVIASFDEGELKGILEDNECGVFTHAGNVQEFVEAVRLLSDNPARCEEMGRNARRFILENLTRSVGTQKYVNIIKKFEQ